MILPTIPAIHKYPGVAVFEEESVDREDDVWVKPLPAALSASLVERSLGKIFRADTDCARCALRHMVSPDILTLRVLKIVICHQFFYFNPVERALRER